jgi:hypothetical protein
VALERAFAVVPDPILIEWFGPRRGDRSRASRSVLGADSCAGSSRFLLTCRRLLPTVRSALRAGDRGTAEDGARVQEAR